MILYVHSNLLRRNAAFNIMNSRGKILVVDSDAVVCMRVAEALQAAGFEVIISTDPEKAVDKARETMPKLVFISLLLHGSNGLKISKTLHFIDELKNVPVIMLISYAGELDPRYTSTLGIIDVIVKPFRPEEILAKTIQILGEDWAASGVEDATQGSSGDDALRINEGRDASAGEEAELLKGEDASVAPPREEIGDGGMGSGDDADDTEKGIDEDENGEEEFSDDMEKHPAQKIIPTFVAVLIIAGLVFGALYIRKIYFTDTEREAPSAVLNESEDEGPIPLETIRETLPATGKKSGETASNGTSGKTESVSIVPIDPREETKALGKKIYSVHLGAFRYKKNAVALADRLKRKGYNVFILKDSKSGVKTLHRVLVGKFKDRDKALEYARIILQQEGMLSFIYRH